MRPSGEVSSARSSQREAGRADAKSDLQDQHGCAVDQLGWRREEKGAERGREGEAGRAGARQDTGTAQPRHCQTGCDARMPV